MAADLENARPLDPDLIAAALRRDVPPFICSDAEVFAQAWRDVGRAMAEALRLPEFVGRLARALDRAEETRQRLRGMVERNATRQRLTVRRDDLRAVLDELDAHRARLAAGGDQ